MDIPDLTLPPEFLEAVAALPPLPAAAHGAAIAEMMLGRPRPQRAPGRLKVAPAAEPQAFDTGSEEVRGWTLGEGPVVVLVHGVNGRAEQVGHWMAPLASAGFRAVAYDAPGHGQTAGRHVTLPGLARGLAAVVAAVGRPHAVVTHSAGAAGLFLAMQEGLGADRYVLIAPPIDFGHWVDAVLHILGVDDAVAEAARRRVEEIGGRPLAVQRVSLPSPLLRGPVLLIHDARDPDVPIACSRVLASAWPGAQTWYTDGLGHTAILTDADVVSRVLAFATDSPIGDRGGLATPRPVDAGAGPEVGADP